MNTCFCANSLYAVSNPPVELEKMSPKVCSISKTDMMSMRKDINASDGYTADETEKSMIEQVRVYFEQELQITDFSKHLLENDLDSDQNEMHNTNNDDTCHKSRTNEVNGLNINIKILEKCVPFPHSKERGSSSLSDKEMENESIILKQSQWHLEDTDSTSAKDIGNKSILKQSQCHLENTDSSTNADGTAYEQSFSLPSRLKLVSAMKGGRQKLGNPSKGKFNVKWAPDVYDPPITLMSHTVKNRHQHRSKTKKKDRNKNKHKGKSSRGSVGDRKHFYRTTSSSITQPLFPRLQAPMDKLLLDGFDQSGVEILDYAVSGTESKCGNNLISGSLAKVQYRTAEAL